MSKVIISEEAIESMILNATLGVEGVLDTWKGFEEYIPYMNKDRQHPHGIDFILADNKLTINVFVIVKYDYNLKKIGEEIQNQIKSQIESMTPFIVTDVNVIIEDIKHES